MKFYIWYNKLASEANGKPQLNVSVGEEGKKFTTWVVDNIFLHVPVKGELNTLSPQFKITGTCNQYVIENNCFYCH